VLGAVRLKGLSTVRAIAEYLRVAPKALRRRDAARLPNYGTTSRGGRVDMRSRFWCRSAAGSQVPAWCQDFEPQVAAQFTKEEIRHRHSSGRSKGRPRRTRGIRRPSTPGSRRVSHVAVQLACSMSSGLGHRQFAHAAPSSLDPSASPAAKRNTLLALSPE
jgi:hypothetical protein